MEYNFFARGFVLEKMQLKYSRVCSFYTQYELNAIIPQIYIVDFLKNGSTYAKTVFYILNLIFNTESAPLQLCH